MSGRNAFDAALVLVVGLFLVACAFAHPTADDFVYASNARAGLWAAWLREYAGWNGRYTSNALVLATPLRYGLAAYRTAAAATIVATVGAIFVAVRAWTGEAIEARDALTCSLAVGALYLSQTPSIGEGVYWYTSAATYQLWAVPVAVYLWVIASRSRATLVVVGSMLLVVIAGFNEVTLLMVIGAHGLWWWTARRTGSNRAGTAATMLGVVVAAGLLVVLSPGNAVRRSMFVGVRHEFWRSLAWTALQTVRFGATWVTAGSLLLATALALPFSVARRPRLEDAPARPVLVAIGAAMLMLVPIATFPAYWETGTLGQHRTVNAAYVMFLALWFAGVWASADEASARARGVATLVAPAKRAIAIAFLAAVAFTGNGYDVGTDLLSGRFAQFDREMTARYAELRACHDRGQTRCAIAPLTVKPSSFSVVDVSADASNWINAAYARFFDLSEVDVRH